jgi:hypothetical protein
MRKSTSVCDVAHVISSRVPGRNTTGVVGNVKELLGELVGVVENMAQEGVRRKKRREKSHMLWRRV